MIQEVVEVSTCIVWTLELLMQQCRLDRVEGTGEIKERDPHSAVCFVKMSLLKQAGDGVFNINLGVVGKLQWVQRGAHLRSEMGQDQSLQDFHDV